MQRSRVESRVTGGDWKSWPVKGETLLARNICRAAVASRCAYENNPRERALQLFNLTRHDLRDVSPLSNVESNRCEGQCPVFFFADTAPDERKGTGRRGSNEPTRKDEPLIVAFQGSTNTDLIAPNDLLSIAKNFPTNFLLREIHKHKRYILLTGHSLGGAIARVVARTLLETVPGFESQVSCITFGAPAIGEGESENRIASNQFLNVIHVRDVLPQLFEAVSLTDPTFKKSMSQCMKTMKDIVSASLVKKETHQTCSLENNFWEKIPWSTMEGLGTIVDTHGSKGTILGSEVLFPCLNNKLELQAPKDRGLDAVKDVLSQANIEFISDCHNIDTYVKLVHVPWMKTLGLIQVEHGDEFEMPSMEYRIPEPLLQAFLIPKPAVSHSEVIFDDKQFRCIVEGYELSFTSSINIRLETDSERPVLHTLQPSHLSTCERPFLVDDTVLAFSSPLPALTVIRKGRIDLFSYFGERHRVCIQVDSIKTHTGDGAKVQNSIADLRSSDLVKRLIVVCISEQSWDHNIFQVVEAIDCLNFEPFLKHGRKLSDDIKKLRKLREIQLNMAQNDWEEQVIAFHSEFKSTVNIWSEAWTKKFEQKTEWRLKNGDDFSKIERRAITTGLQIGPLSPPIPTNCSCRIVVPSYACRLLWLHQWLKICNTADTSLYKMESLIQEVISEPKTSPSSIHRYDTSVEKISEQLLKVESDSKSSVLNTVKAACASSFLRKALSEKMAVGIVGQKKVGKSSLVRNLTENSSIVSGGNTQSSTFVTARYSLKNSEITVMDFPGMNETLEIRDMYEYSLDLAFAFVTMSDVEYVRTGDFAKTVLKSLSDSNGKLRNSPVVVCLNKADKYLADAYEERGAEFDLAQSVREAQEGAQEALKARLGDIKVEIWVTAFKISERNLNALNMRESDLISAGVKTVEHLQIWILKQQVLHYGSGDKNRICIPNKLERRFSSEKARRLVNHSGKSSRNRESFSAALGLGFFEDMDFFTALSFALYGSQHFSVDLDQLAKTYEQHPSTRNRLELHRVLFHFANTFQIRFVVIGFVGKDFFELYTPDGPGKKELIVLFRLSSDRYQIFPPRIILCLLSLLILITLGVFSTFRL